MTKTLAKQIKEIAEGNGQKDIAEKFLSRLKERSLTRDENTQTHFCVYFLPFNPEMKQVFIGDHKKSGLWLVPGGHIDQGENLFAATNREISEELGVANYFSEIPKPFLLTITHITNERQSCKTHYDIWYLMETNGSNFQVDFTEFHQVKWLSISEARKYVTDSSTLKSFEKIEKLYT